MKAIHTYIMMSLVTLLLTTSCRDRHDEPRRRPTIDCDALTLTTGETGLITVDGCERLRAVAESDIIAVRVDGHTIYVKAISPGVTSVSIHADDALLRCRVTIGPSAPVIPDDPDTPDEPDDDTELADTSWRYSSATLTMTHDTPGTIFMRDTGGASISIRSLTTGDCASISFTTPPSSQGDTDGVSLSVNGLPVALTAASVERIDGNTMWLKLRTANWHHTIWVVTPVSY